MEQYRPHTTKLAVQSNMRYHVFLSFRGPDVRKTLVDHLFQALSVAGLNVFLDTEKLEKGEIIGLSLERAIESSAIRIPILSKGYADSAWCLKEAAAMLRTRGLTIPLFYHVDPSHVRYPQNESSPYKESFLRHYARPDRYSREEIDEWKNALLQICSLSGWSTDITQGFEARLVKIVVNDLVKTFDRLPLEVAEHPVGIDSLKNTLIQKLNVNSVEEVVKVGIWGIGGIGKTTAAKVVYNQIYNDFEATSFVFNVHTTAADSSGLTNLQKQILKDLTKYGGNVHSVDQGISLMRDRLGGKRLLLVLDDVDTSEQLYALVGDWLVYGSRVIITCRNKHILNLARVSSECIHEMSGLEINEGLQLFSWHAFLRASPSPNYEDLSVRIVEACKGHPLSLEVIGSLLYDKQDNIGYWSEALENITLHPEIHERLYISYSALSQEEKEIFLDIACFFIGENKTLPIVFWKSLYRMVDSAVSNLSMKLLIKIDGQGFFDMHDHLRDMGRSIAEKEKESRRQWEATNLITESSNIKISRLRLNGGNPKRLEVLYRTCLHYLHLQNLPIECMTEQTLATLPKSLTWLRLEHCPFTIGKIRAVKKLGPFKIGTNKAVKKTGHSRFVSNILQLKIMQVKGCSGLDRFAISWLFSLPDIQLQHLYLKGCKDLNNLPSNIGKVSQLQHLDLEGCINLKNLPYTIGNLSQLQHLSLGWCESLSSLPDTIGKLSQLQHLDLVQCDRLENLPDTIGNLSQLQHLCLAGCRRLNNLPVTIGSLSELQHLNLEGCISINSLPDTVGSLSQLHHLNLEGCISINSFPDTIGSLSQLQHLNLEGCRSINNLPATIGCLSQLQHLNLGWCDVLKDLPDTIGNLSRLQHLDLEGCINLKNLPDTIGNMSQLQNLDLGWCRSLKNLPDTIGKLSQLHRLKLRGCESLNNLPGTVGSLSQVQYFF